MTETVLVIDDDAAIRRAIVKAFPNEEVLEAESIAAGIEAMQEGYPDLILLDQRLPDGTGSEQIPRLLAIDHEVPVVLMTGHGSVELAVDALKMGIADYIEKPFKLERLRTTVGNLLEKQRLGRQVARLSGSGPARTQLVAQSPGMKKVMALVRRVAAVPGTTVLVQGESGTGKELVARSIHERSARSDKRFVAINCAALSEHLLEAELFGYEKGAFTGADARGKEGLFQAAEGGTIFLDEVGEMPLQLQTKLLRVLQERRVRKVGGLDDIDVDVRVLAATNRDLRREVAASRFRNDLYYRLRVVPIQVPPLRERKEDILAIAQVLLKRLRVELDRPDLDLSEAARMAMRDYDWPGNVRELANAIERAVITCTQTSIQSEDLVLDEELLSATPEDGSPALPPGTLVFPPGHRHLGTIEREVIRAALEEAGGQKSKAADMLGINRTTLYNKLREL